MFETLPPVVVAKAENEKYRITISVDEDAESPREWDTLGTMVCWHKRYNLGDEHSHRTPRDFLESLAVEMGMDPERAEFKCTMEQLLEFIEKKGVLILPLYLYDHSGITMSTQPFSCPWDSGQVGWIYVTPEKIRQEYGVKRISKKVREKAREVLISEVEVYDQYISGEVYCYTIEEKVQVGDGEYEYQIIDSCCGFYGHDPFKNGMAENIDEIHHELLRSL